MADDQHIEVPFTGGLDLDTSERSVASPKLLEAENVVLTEGGRAKKRRGFEDLGTNAASGIFSLQSDGDQLSVRADGLREVYHKDLGLWINSFDKSNPSALSESRVIGARSSHQPVDYASCTIRDAHVISAGSVASLVPDGADRFTTTGIAPSSTTAYMRLVSFSTTQIAAVWTSTADANLRVSVSSAINGSWSNAVTVATNVDGSIKWLEAAAISSTQIAVAYHTTTATTIRTLIVNVPTPSAGASRDDTYAGTLRALGIYFGTLDNAGITIIADSTNGVVAKHYDGTLTGTASSTVDAAVTDCWAVGACKGTAADRILIAYDVNGTRAVDHDVELQEVTDDPTTGAPVGGSHIIRNVGLAAAPFFHDDIQHIPCVWHSDTNFEATVLLYSLWNSFPYLTSRALYLTHAGLPERSALSNTEESETAGVYCASMMATSRFTNEGSVLTGAESVPTRVEFNVGEKRRIVPSYYGRSEFIPSGSAHRIGIPHAPDIELTPVNSAGGAKTVNSTYSVAAVIQEIDRYGGVHWSVPSVVTAVALGPADDGITVDIIARVESGHEKVLLFCSPANDANVLHLDKVIDLGFTGSTSTTLEQADSAIEDNEILYTNGNARLPKHRPPPCRFSTIHDDRVWVISNDDGSIWPSHRISAPEAPSFSPEIAIAGEIDGRRPVALGSLTDSRLVVLWPHRAGIVYGTGPDSAGAGSNYTAPQALSSPTGTGDPRSVLSIHLGVLFQGEMRGYYLVDNSGQVNRISDGVRDYDADECVAAVHVPAQKEVVFVTLSGSDTRLLWWAYEIDAWTTTLISSKTAVDATLHKGRLAIAFDDNDVWLEWDSDRYDHGGTDVATGAHAPMSIKLPWLKYDGKQGRFHPHGVEILGERDGLGDMDVEIRSDYQSTPETASFTGSEMLVEPMQFQVIPKSTDAEAISIRIVQKVGGGNNNSPGFSLDSIRVRFVPGSSKSYGHFQNRKGAS